MDKLVNVENLELSLKVAKIYIDNKLEELNSKINELSILLQGVINEIESFDIDVTDKIQMAIDEMPIKTINGYSLKGEGNIYVAAIVSDKS